MRYLPGLFLAMLVSGVAVAQVRVNLNVDRQPIWGPTGYDRVEYYYLPDIETYYYVPQQKYYYYEGGQWISGPVLPPQYANYDLYKSYKVVVNEPTPYLKHKIYKKKYFSFRGRSGQEVIRDSHDSKYFVNVHHPEHGNWEKQQKHDNGKGKEKSQGKSKRK